MCRCKVDTLVVVQCGPGSEEGAGSDLPQTGGGEQETTAGGHRHSLRLPQGHFHFRFITYPFYTGSLSRLFFNVPIFGTETDPLK